MGFNKIKCIKVGIDKPLTTSFVVPLSDLSELQEELEAADVGFVYTLQRIDLTQKEYDSLPEFDGF